MTINLNGLQITDVRLGSAVVQNVYLGTQEVFPGIPRPDETVDPAGAYIWDVEAYGGQSIEQGIKDAWTTFINTLNADPEGNRYRLAHICIMCGHKVPQSSMVQPFYSEPLAKPGPNGIFAEPLFANTSQDNVMPDRKYIQVGSASDFGWGAYEKMKAVSPYSNHPLLAPMTPSDAQNLAQYAYVRPEPPNPGSGNYNKTVFLDVEFDNTSSDPSIKTTGGEYAYRSYQGRNLGGTRNFGTSDVTTYEGWLSYSRQDISNIAYREGTGLRVAEAQSTATSPNLTNAEIQIGSTSYGPHRLAVALFGFHLDDTREEALRGHVQTLVDAVDAVLGP